LDQLRQ